MKAKLALEDCHLCPHDCGVNRFKETGFCHSSNQIKINLTQKHFGEEPVFSGTQGSGTIFFSHCNMRCVYCQNYRISQWGWGREITVEKLAKEMIKLQQSGAHNINLVSPSQYTYSIRESIKIAKEIGLKIPVIWNSNAFEKVETLALLTDLVDIYLPDLRYFCDESGRKYSSVPRYFEFASLAIKEMFRQVGYLHIENELAVSGILIRLLVLPNQIEEMKQMIHWLADHFGNQIHFSLMAQYYPTYRAKEFPELNQPIQKKAYEELVSLCEDLKLENGYIQELQTSSEWRPDFKEENEKRNRIS